MKHATSFLLVLFAFAAHANDSYGSSVLLAAYFGQQTHLIKSLSPEEIQGLEVGKGMGLAKSAELNHFTQGQNMHWSWLSYLS